ncbi:MAG: hypothetical protein E6L07_13820 [Verrucomicrobia bacterium]|nr:MAG: hypothetical protein E6L07_13820 [Verrucomicrobiota bacterium]
MKYLLMTVAIVAAAAALPTSTVAQTHGHGVGRTYTPRTPQMVQERAISREPVYAWEGPEEYLAEQSDGTVKRMPSKKQRVLKGYNVRYRIIYDNGSQAEYTTFEPAG